MCELIWKKQAKQGEKRCFQQTEESKIRIDKSLPADWQPGQLRSRASVRTTESIFDSGSIHSVTRQQLQPLCQA